MVQSSLLMRTSDRATGNGFGGRQSHMILNQAYPFRIQLTRNAQEELRKWILRNDADDPTVFDLLTVGCSSDCSELTLARLIHDGMFIRYIDELEQILPRVLTNMEPSCKALFADPNAIGALSPRLLQYLQEDFPEDMPGRHRAGNGLQYATAVSKWLNAQCHQLETVNAELLAYLVPHILTQMSIDKLVAMAKAMAKHLPRDFFLPFGIPDFHQLHRMPLCVGAGEVGIERAGRSFKVTPFPVQEFSSIPEEHFFHNGITDGQRVLERLEESGIKHALWHRGKVWRFDNVHFHPGIYPFADGRPGWDGILEYPISYFDENGREIDLNGKSKGEIHVIYQRKELVKGQLATRFMTIGAHFQVHPEGHNPVLQPLLDTLPKNGAVEIGKKYPYQGDAINILDLFGSRIEQVEVLLGNLFYNAWGSPSLRNVVMQNGGSHTYYTLPITMSSGQFAQMRSIVPELTSFSKSFEVAPVPRTPAVKCRIPDVWNKYFDESKASW